MHAQVRLPDPGPCPICGMDLVPEEPGSGGDSRRIELTTADRELARIRTAPVRREFAARSVRMVGKLDFDETGVRTISARVPGRLDRLYVDYTGVRVQRGEHLVWLYSPELSTAQEELLGARERLGSGSKESSEFLAESNRRAYEAAREKLLLWGLTTAQIEELEARGSAEDHMMLTSPASGIVIEKALDEGDYVQTGSRIYSIADLSRLWVKLDAYEQDLAWLRYGQEVTIQTEAFPGETYTGRIAFIDPIVHESTRTAKVRVNVDNADGRLKPGMFVRAAVSARLGAGGVVLDPYLAGKWISPMHPEIVKDEPGSCDVCGMDLVPAEELGLVSGEPARAPLLVPASAVLVTGRRAVVYVEVPDAEEPTYEGREITLGPRAGDVYLVASGLEEGERVVVQGAFRLDSSMQIRARPSMMSMAADERADDGPEALAFRAALRPVLDRYFELQLALAADEAEAAATALEALHGAVDAVEPDALGGGDALAAWEAERARLHGALSSAGEDRSIEALRTTFRALSTPVLSLAARLAGGDETLYEVHCPMAFDFEGASWLQADAAVRNPYFGAEMLECGTARPVGGR